jgi:hypothetical protein
MIERERHGATPSTDPFYWSDSQWHAAWVVANEIAANAPRGQPISLDVWRDAMVQIIGAGRNAGVRTIGRGRIPDPTGELPSGNSPSTDDGQDTEHSGD